ncbi:MAG: hypothetical protein GWO81_07835 [Verrucomicrobia bacterium]|nr:hypothetical protein [Verrucomicrobiota bacterium]
MAKVNKNSRRNFIKGASLTGLAGMFTHASVAAEPKVEPSAKNLIFLVADGMGTGTLSLAHYWQLRNKGRPLNWMHLLERRGVRRALQGTASASSPVTDSAAAGSAWGCGQRVNNGSININPRGKSLEPLFVRAKKAGKVIGCVSTCRITHATPAAFVANVAHRDSEDVIAEQYLEREVDVLLGGGRRYFESSTGNRMDAFVKKGYAISKTLGDLQALSGQGGPLLGLYTDDHLPYALDRAQDRALAEIPGLEIMFEAALSRLSDSREGFLLQVEAGRIDHAGHVNDGAAILHEQLEFDRCIETALQFCERHPDTLLIVTSDHGTGGCQLNGAGEAYKNSGAALDGLNSMTASLEAIAGEVKRTGSLYRAYFKSVTGLDLPEEKVAVFNKAFLAGAEYPAGLLADTFKAELGLLTAVGWTSHNHTAEHVELAAIGPGASLIPPYLENYQLHGHICRALGI